MTTINLKQILNKALFGASPYGNETTHFYTLNHSAAGIVVGGDDTLATAIGDIVRLGVIPAGMEIHDALAIISTAFTAATTAKLGFAYVDGVDDTAFPQNDAYFLNVGQSLATAARVPMNNVAAYPNTLNKDAYLILTTAGAAQAKASRLDVLIRGINRGPK